MTPIPLEPQNILLIKPSAIGDVVHTLPILNLIRRRWPRAKISWLVTPACAGLITGHPMLHEVILFDRKGLASSWRHPRATLALWRFIRSLRRRQFDLVVDLQGLLRSGWMTWKTHAPVRVGFADAREGGWLFYNHRVSIDTREQHAIGRYLKIAAALGCETGPIEYPWATDQADRDFVATLVPPGKRFAVLFPGTNWVTKRWPVESFAALVEPLRNRFGLDAIVGGGPAETALAAQIPALDLTGKTNLRQLVALLERADLVIANDSGPMHIASALNRPLVTMFGPTNPIRTGPYQRMDTVIQLNVICSPCYSKKCSHMSCLRGLTPEMVLDRCAMQLRV